MMRSLLHAAFALSMAALPGSGSLELERTGDVLQIALPAGAGACALVLRDWVGARQLGLLVIVSQGATHLLKHTLKTPRPDGGRNGFPSAHTSSAFAGSGFVAQRYGHRYAWPLHLAAALTGYSRMTAHKHFLVDVAGGASLSLLCSLGLVRRRKRDVRDPSPEAAGSAEGAP